MLKNIQIKTVMIFAILGIIVITSLGMFFLYRLEYVEKIIIDEAVANQEVLNAIDEQINDTKNVVYNSLGMFSIVSIIVGFIVSKLITSPISTFAI